MSTEVVEVGTTPPPPTPSAVGVAPVTATTESILPGISAASLAVLPPPPSVHQVAVEPTPMEVEVESTQAAPGGVPEGVGALAAAAAVAAAAPSVMPTVMPSVAPTVMPTVAPTVAPTAADVPGPVPMGASEAIGMELSTESVGAVAAAPSVVVTAPVPAPSVLQGGMERIPIGGVSKDKPREDGVQPTPAPAPAPAPAVPDNRIERMI